MAKPSTPTDGSRGALPRIVVAMGDPAGIGPEITVKALSEPEVRRVCVPVVIGDAGALSRAPGWAGGEPRLQVVSRVEDASPEPGMVSVLDLSNVPSSLKAGKASAEGGKACLEYLARGMQLGMEKQVDALVFAPLNKEAMKKAGSPFVDEYGYLCHVAGVPECAVLMVSPSLTLASVTLHVPFGEVARMITKESVLASIRYGYRAALASGKTRPKIGVAALNPHAGEGGTLGLEERDAIRPAVEAARDEGIDAHGPFPADSFFMTARDSQYDVYVGMYHDQGRIALKLLDFGHATTMAEGLPVLVCTVGSGTAYDIAGKGVARHQNLVETIQLAARRVARR